MGRSSSSHGKKPARKLPRKQWKTDEQQAVLEQRKVFRDKKRLRQSERIVDTSVPLKRDLSSTEKRVRALNKKLRAVEGLQTMAAKGTVLDEQQQEKLDSLGALLSELDELGVRAET